MLYLEAFNDLLKKKLLETGRRTRDDFLNEGYFLDEYNKNFFEIMTDKTRQEYEDGDGDELSSGKMKQIRSSSAMIYNILGNDNVKIKNNKELPAGIYSKNYEKKLKTISVYSKKTQKRENVYANLDAWLCNDETEIFVESKCLEWLENGTDFYLKDSYSKLSNYLYKETAKDFINIGKKIGCSQYDSCQMFKHTLAIYNYLKESGIINKKIYLVNLVWELPKDSELESKYQARYQIQKDLEHLEFNYFYEQMKEIKKLFLNNAKCPFEIKYFTVQEFCAILDHNIEKQNYLKRYL